jgi:hypothetical protein
MLNCLFICDLFNDAASNLDYISPCYWMELNNGLEKGCGRKR